ncbi:MAG: tetratricopeptide repeat protein [Cyclobacteriaceae bacterium]
MRLSICIILATLNLTVAGQNNIVNSLNTQAYQLLTTQPDSAYNLTRKSIDLAYKSNDFKGAAYGHFYAGYVLQQKGYLKTSLEQYMYGIEAIKLVEGQSARSLEIQLKNYCAWIYQLGDKHHRSVQYSDSAIQIAKSIDQKSILPSLYRNKGITLVEDGKPDEALTPFLEALDIATNLNDVTEQSALFNELGIAFIQVEKYPESRKYFYNLISSEADLGIDVWTANAYHQIAYSQYLEGNLSEAIDSYKHSIEYAKERANAKVQFLSSLDLGELFLNQGEANAALQHLNTAVAFYNTVEPTAEHFVLFLHLSKAYKSIGLLDESLTASYQYSSEFEKFTDLQLNLRQKELGDGLEAQAKSFWEARKNERMVSGLLNTRNVLILIASLGLIGFVVYLVVGSYNKSRKKSKNKDSLGPHFSDIN